MRLVYPVVAVLLPWLAPASPALGSPQTGSTRVVVHLTPDANPAEVACCSGTEVVGSVPGTHLHLLESPGELSDAELQQLLLVLDGTGQTFFAEGNRRMALPEADSCGPGGDFATQQCTIGFVDGEPAMQTYTNQYWLWQIWAPYAQLFSWGYPSIVAVIDTGVDMNHPALQSRMLSEGYDFIRNEPGAWEVRDGIDDDQDGTVDEAYGHGTHLAGIITLINPDAYILPYRVANADGQSTSFAVARAIYRAVADGADVINLSLSTYENSMAVAEASNYALSQDVAVFTSAGNTAAPVVLYPAALPTMAGTYSLPPADAPHGVIAVTSVNPWFELSDFAAWGHEVDVCAPGEAIYSAFPDNQWAWWSGTSMACAVASGSASLMNSTTPGTKGVPCGELMYYTALFIGYGWLNPGKGWGTGYGCIDAFWASYILWLL